MRTVGSFPFIHAGVVAPFAEFIAANGGIIEPPFSRAGVPVELADAKDQIIPTADYLSLLEQGAQELRDEHFGSALGESLTLRQLGSFGRLVAAASTLGAAIDTANALIPHYSSAAHSWLDVEGNKVYWRYRLEWQSRTIGDTYRDGRRFDGELALTLFRDLIRLAAGCAWQPLEMHLDQETVRHALDLQSRFGVPCRRRSGSYALVFSRDLLALPMTYSRRLTERDRKAHLERLTALDPGDSFVALMKAIIRAQLHGGYPEIATVARASRLSVRTLQRRLAQEDLTFSRLVTAVRQQAACELLADPDLEQIEVSLSLGYSDAANFSRAFKKWTGKTPGAYRQARLWRL